MTKNLLDKNVQRRLNVTTIGIELEFYSQLSPMKTANRANDLFGSNLWNGGTDGSLIGKTSGGDAKYKNDIIRDAIKTIAKYHGINKKEMISSFLSKIGKGPHSSLGLHTKIYNRGIEAINMSIPSVENEEIKNKLQTVIEEVTLLQIIQTKNQSPLIDPIVECKEYLESIESEMANCLSQFLDYRDSEFAKYKERINKRTGNKWGDYSKYGRDMDRKRGEIAYYLYNENSETKAMGYAIDSGMLNNWLKFSYRENVPKNLTKSKTGVELRFSKPRSLRSCDSYIHNMVALVNDSKINGTFVEEEGGGETGIHVHIGMNDQVIYTSLDFISLLIDVTKKEKQISKLAGRPVNGSYRTSMGNYHNILIRELKRVINNGRGEYYEHSNKYCGYNTFRCSGHINGNKLNKSYKTIEFRWGNSSLAKDESKLQKYVNYLKDLVATNMISNHELVVDVGKRKVILKETHLPIRGYRDSSETTARINVFDFTTGKYLGYLKYNNSPAVKLNKIRGARGILAKLKRDGDMEPKSSFIKTFS